MEIVFWNLIKGTMPVKNDNDKTTTAHFDPKIQPPKYISEILPEMSYYNFP